MFPESILKVVSTVREKVASIGEEGEVIYTDSHWRLLKSKRMEAKRLVDALTHAGLPSIVHGSIARGDVHAGSDIDVFIPMPVPSYRVELALENAGYRIYLKKIVQATPSHHPKVYYVLDPSEKMVVSHPLGKMGRRELEFYYFGGALEGGDLAQGKRVPGVNKRLLLIIPTERGHRAENIVGREAQVAKILGISVDTVLERVRVLSRRDQVGRTGVFLEIELQPNESVEEAVSREAANNPMFRRMLGK